MLLRELSETNDPNGTINSFNLHFVSSVDLVNENIGTIGIFVSIVVFTLLPYLTIGKSYDRFAAPSLESTVYLRFNHISTASVVASRKRNDIYLHISYN